jgi:hypothetical protein
MLGLAHGYPLHELNCENARVEVLLLNATIGVCLLKRSVTTVSHAVGFWSAGWSRIYTNMVQLSKGDSTTKMRWVSN